MTTSSAPTYLADSMVSPPRKPWLHPIAIVGGFIVVSEAAVVGYESCAPRSNQPEESTVPKPTPLPTFTAATVVSAQSTSSYPSPPARPRAVLESPAVPRALAQPTQTVEPPPTSSPPEGSSAAVANARQTARKEMARALSDQIARLEAELGSGDAGDVETKRTQLIEARSKLDRLNAGVLDVPGLTKEPDAGR